MLHVARYPMYPLGAFHQPHNHCEVSWIALAHQALVCGCPTVEFCDSRPLSVWAQATQFDSEWWDFSAAGSVSQFAEEIACTYFSLLPSRMHFQCCYFSIAILLDSFVKTLLLFRYTGKYYNYNMRGLPSLLFAKSDACGICEPSLATYIG